MCACAGSSTDRTTSLSPALPGTVRIAREVFSSTSPARSGWISSSAGQGFMSTQRRENRWQRLTCTERRDAPEPSSSGPFALNARVRAMVGTAPPQHAARLATNSLQADYRSVRLIPQDFRHSSRSAPPSPAAARAASAGPAAHALSLRRIPHPPALALLHPSLP